MDLTAFRVAYPEHKGATDPRVTAALNDAARDTDAEVFGDQYDLAHGLLAAHLLSNGPAAKESRFKGDQAMTVYLAERKRLESIYCAGYGVTP